MVCEEFFNQGDTERKLQLSVTPLCDRYKTTVAKIQSGTYPFPCFFCLKISKRKFRSVSNFWGSY